MWKITPLLIILHSALGRIEPRIDPLVLTKLGLIRGLIAENGEYSTYLGIPYGLVDEDNPFSPSNPHPVFNSTFNAFDGSVACPQMSRDGNPKGIIQCLHLNIYVPNKSSSQHLLPVMVYIHGGVFILGSGTNSIENPINLVEKDVIVITLNYRLGIYGFMCTDNSKSPGNIGFRDQHLALKWINENIGSFGGDNTKVTIFGQSAGGMAVHMHLLSHHEQLFHRAIIQSGTMTSPWTVGDIDNSVPLRVAEILGFLTEDVDEALDVIAKADPHLAVAAAYQLMGKFQYTGEPPTKPCIEKEFEGIERFITENPNLAKSAKARIVPIMIGYASQELIYDHITRNDDFFNNYSFENMLYFGFDVFDFDEMTDVVKQFYIGDEAPSENLNNEITSFASDFIFNYPTEKAVDLLLQSEAKAIYYYTFSYLGGRSTIKTTNTSLAGSSHSDDIKFLFDSNKNKNSEDDQLLINRMIAMWTNFAKYGDPTPETSDLLPEKWLPVSEDVKHYLNIDKNFTVQSRPFHHRMAFWELFYKLNEDKIKWHDFEV